MVKTSLRCYCKFNTQTKHKFTRENRTKPNHKINPGIPGSTFSDPKILREKMFRDWNSYLGLYCKLLFLMFKYS